MASIGNDPNGHRRILFVAGDGKRKTIRLGKITRRDAESVKVRVERLVSAAVVGHPPDDETSRWLVSLDDVLYEKLVSVGLAPERAKPVAEETLDGFLEAYIKGRTDVKERTRINLEQSRRKLVKYFGVLKPLVDITAGDAEDFRRWMLARLGENTSRRHCGRAKQFLAYAVRKRLVAANPFLDLRGCGVKGNPERLYLVSREESQAVLEACPDSQWRVLFALARFGGLRTPSETLLLRWSDIFWDSNRFRVTSPKTAHHSGKGERIVPLFPELRTHLEKARNEAEPGAEFVITRYRNANANLRTHLDRIIQWAGLKPWPKLFHNLRATRETELAQSHPLHVVCEWIGNSQLVAAKHYLSTSETDFAKATYVVDEAAQIPAQYPAESKGIERNATEPTNAETPALAGVYAKSVCFVASAKRRRMPPLGVEPRTC